MPPVCTGDAVLCGIAAQQWQATCAVQLGLNGSVSPPAFTPHTMGDLPAHTVNLSDTSKLDTSGFGFSTSCPFQPVTFSIMGKAATISFQPVCDYGPWMRGLVLAFAAFTCALILGGQKVGGIF